MDLVEKYMGEGLDPAKRAEMIKKRKEYEKSSKGRAMAKKRQQMSRKLDRQGGKGMSSRLK